LHLFRIEGAGGQLLPFYLDAVLHPLLQPHEKDYVKELQRVSLLSYQAHRARFDLLSTGEHPYLLQYPQPIRRFKFPEEKTLQQDDSFFPIFVRCTRANGLLNLQYETDRFMDGNFSYPSVRFDQKFQDTFTYPQRVNAIQAQIDPQEYKNSPLFQSLRGQERVKQTARRWSKRATNTLERNQHNPEVEQVIDQIRDMPIGYGPLFLLDQLAT
jgi:hypothetical protein